VAESLSVLDVTPSRAEIDHRVAQVATGRFRRPVLVLGIDVAYVPSRPEHARGRHPGRARYQARRAQWRLWYEAKGFRFYLLDSDRIVHLLSWHQVQSEDDLGKALKQVKDAGLIPEQRFPRKRYGFASSQLSLRQGQPSGVFRAPLGR
jgi:hypothetical protein